MSSSDRAIPHLRDIFGISGYTTSHTDIRDRTVSPKPIRDTSYTNNQIHQHQQADILPMKKSSKERRDNSKTLTASNVKTLERHLSMKKTIRKKIMRDLQQAFVDDPNEFKVENSNTEHLKSELSAETLRFGGEHPNKKSSDNFLVMLRGDQHQRNGYDYGSNAQHREYDYDSTPTQHQQRDDKPSFWKRFTMKNKTKR